VAVGGGECFEPGELQAEMVDKVDGAPLRTLQVEAADGRLVGPRDFRLTSRV